VSATRLGLADAAGDTRKLAAQHINARARIMRVSAMPARSRPARSRPARSGSAWFGLSSGMSLERRVYT
jgi:hypothetical protein